MAYNDILADGTVLNGGGNGPYTIYSRLGRGGFGITYAARSMAGVHVAIKEFFPKGLCSRDPFTGSLIVDDFENLETVHRLRERFVRESQNIAQCDHRNIVHIIETFEENGTAYMVMEHVEGRTLKQIVNQEECTIDWTIEMTKVLAQALQYLHNRNITHLDIKPDNIIVKEGNVPVIIDFGLSRKYDEAGSTDSNLVAAISKGYTAIEQYQPKPKFSPESDIYSLAATCVFMLNKQTPPEPSETLASNLTFPARTPKKVRQALAHALEFSPAKRTDTMGQFLGELNGKILRQDNKPGKPTEHDDKHVETHIPQEVHHDPKSTSQSSNTFLNLLLLLLMLVCGLNATVYKSTGGSFYLFFHVNAMEFCSTMAGIAGASLIALLIPASAFKKTILWIGVILAAVFLANFHWGT